MCAPQSPVLNAQGSPCPGQHDSDPPSDVLHMQIFTFLSPMIGTKHSTNVEIEFQLCCTSFSPAEQINTQLNNNVVSDDNVLFRSQSVPHHHGQGESSQPGPSDGCGGQRAWSVWGGAGRGSPDSGPQVPAGGHCGGKALILELCGWLGIWLEAELPQACVSVPPSSVR